MEKAIINVSNHEGYTAVSLVTEGRILTHWLTDEEVLDLIADLTWALREKHRASQ